MSGDKLLLKLHDEWSVRKEAERENETRRDMRKEYVTLAGVFTGVLVWKDDECTREYDVVLGLLLKENGGVSGVKYSEEGGKRLPDATIDKSRSRWKLRKLGKDVKVDLRLVLTSDKSSLLVEGLANPVSKVIQTVTWQKMSGPGGYQSGSDLCWRGDSIASARSGLMRSSPPKPDTRKRGRDSPEEPDAKRRKAEPQVLFIDDAEAARARAYHKIHGKFPPEIQQRMVSKGLIKDTSAEETNWNSIKDAYDKSRHRGGDGSLPSGDRSMRINSWLLEVVVPTPGSPDALHSAALQTVMTPQKPNPHMPPPGTAALDTSNQRATMWRATNALTAQSPTYLGATGLSPYPHSALADRGDETPLYDMNAAKLRMLPVKTDEPT